jgi:hypothetical protein
MSILLFSFDNRQSDSECSRATFLLILKVELAAVRPDYLAGDIETKTRAG